MRTTRTPLALAIPMFFFACSGDTGPQGPAGPQGSQGAQGSNAPVALSGVVPRTGLLDRELDVTVLGSGTSFDPTSDVSFGPGVTVSNVSVISPTAIGAHLRIDGGTTVGLRDVTVHSGASLLVAHGAFGVAGDIDVTLGKGSAVQGGVIEIGVHDNDQMDFGMGMQSQAIGTFASLGMSDGVAQTGTRASFVAFIDPLAPVGPNAAEIANLALSLDDAVFFPETFLSASNAIDVTARAPKALNPNMALPNEYIETPYGTQLYKTTPTQTGLMEIVVVPIMNSMVARLNVYGSSGTSRDFIASKDLPGNVRLQIPVIANTDIYSVVSDDAFGGGSLFTYGFIIGVGMQVPDVVVAEQTGDHYLATTAQNLDTACAGWSKLCMITGNIGLERQRDVYQLPAFGSMQWLNTFVTTTSDVHIWLAQASGPTLVPIGPDLSPAWPSHLSPSNSVSGSSGQPYFLVIEGRGGGMTPLGAYTLAVTMNGP